jgi:hypothetical protein
MAAAGRTITGHGCCDGLEAANRPPPGVGTPPVRCTCEDDHVLVARAVCEVRERTPLATSGDAGVSPSSLCGLWTPLLLC